jgi:hypothetical protein
MIRMSSVNCFYYLIQKDQFHDFIFQIWNKKLLKRILMNSEIYESHISYLTMVNINNFVQINTI